MLITFIIIAVIVVILAIWAFKTYNKLVRLRNFVEESTGQIATQLQRRFDLIPNLVSTVKGYAAHEESTFKAITNARAAAGRAAKSGTAEDITEAQDSMQQAQVAINAVAEAYPDLKANTNFLNLQEELTSTENKVSFARRSFNEAVNDYNTAVQSVPSNIIASIGKFEAKSMFEVEHEEAKKAPKVEF